MVRAPDLLPALSHVQIVPIGSLSEYESDDAVRSVVKISTQKLRAADNGRVIGRVRRLR